mmetsp:Transcript_19214/g.13815  ORF Transcript_19214/g.13815 Transcript_19214/m.13815 type:complete len:84 (+) Transcript_19214:134-385(+)
MICIFFSSFFFILFLLNIFKLITVSPAQLLQKLHLLVKFGICLSKLFFKYLELFVFFPLESISLLYINVYHFDLTLENDLSFL